jgi:hypothetical protein
MLPLFMIPIVTPHPPPHMFNITLPSNNDTMAGNNSTSEAFNSTSMSTTSAKYYFGSVALTYSAIVFITIPLVALAIVLANKSFSRKDRTEGIDSNSSHELIEFNDMESSLHDCDEFGNDLKINKILFHKIGRKNSSDLMIIKRGISKALNGYSPSIDSEDNYSPFEHPSISI